MRLHRLDYAAGAAAAPAGPGPAGRQRRRPRAWPAAPSPTSRPLRGELAQSRHGDRPRSTPRRRQWRADMPYLQLGDGAGPGHRGSCSPATWPAIDAIVAAEFADLADAGDFRLGSGYLPIVRAQAARLRGRLARPLRTAPAGLRGAGHRPGLRRAGPRRAGPRRRAARRRRRRRRGDGRGRPLHSPAMEVLYPWLEQARAAVAGRLAATWRPRPSVLAGCWRTGCAATASPAHEMFALHDLVRLGQRRPRSATGSDALSAHRRAVAELADRSMACARARPGIAGPRRRPPRPAGRRRASFADLGAQPATPPRPPPARSPCCGRIRSPRTPRAAQRLAELLRPLRRPRTRRRSWCRSRR